MNYFVKIDGQERGPVNSKQLKVLAEKGRIKEGDFVRKETSQNWHKASNIKGLFETKKELVKTFSPPSQDFSPQQKSCDFCGESILLIAKKCRHCGEILDYTLRQSVMQNTVSSTAVASDSAVRWSPLLAAILSFIIPGLGQLYKGQPINGLAWLIVVLIGYVAFIVPGLVLHLCCVIGAAMSN